jgi:hypothetical protein
MLSVQKVQMFTEDLMKHYIRDDCAVKEWKLNLQEKNKLLSCVCVCVWHTFARGQLYS